MKKYLSWFCVKLRWEFDGGKFMVVIDRFLNYLVVFV